ncbi:hypothetical protein DM02DRAFT_700547 [Periconia macrospinosa]|uniref:Uncharacterized protein n=1 Tax=Periconia macrospinosa TaxID=97972 RepID=A0A2V1EAS4_9PLEO|nr:hypothetical protein DM02DRAFT_700547 [Periconia macrospinosa]
MENTGWLDYINDRLTGLRGPTASPAEERNHSDELTDQVPSLLNQELPPCGPIPQVAYENVNTELCSLWFQYEGKKPLDEICRAVHQDLLNEKLAYDAPKMRWRRTEVFHYEIRWASYFVRESQRPELLTESELLEQHKESFIPTELGFTCGSKHLLELWEEWHRKKRAISTQPPSIASLG